MISRIQESVTITDRFMEIPFHRKLSQVKNAKDNDTNSRGEFVAKKNPQIRFLLLLTLFDPI